MNYKINYSIVGGAGNKKSINDLINLYKKFVPLLLEKDINIIDNDNRITKFVI